MHANLGLYCTYPCS